MLTRLEVEDRAKRLWGGFARLERIDKGRWNVEDLNGGWHLLDGNGHAVCDHRRCEQREAGQLVEVYTAKSTSPSLAEAQRIVGGDVRMVMLADGQMLVDEDGLPKELPVNVEASALAGQMIVGNVIVLRGSAALR